MSADCVACDAEGVAHRACPELYARECGGGGHAACDCGPCAACGGRTWVAPPAPPPEQLALPGVDLAAVCVDRCYRCRVVRQIVARLVPQTAGFGDYEKLICEACVPWARARVGAA